MKHLIPLLAACLAYAICAPAKAACFAADTTPGIVQATVIGIEIRDGCTYVLVKNVQTTLAVIDTNPFAAGRYPYLALDPAHAMYKPFLVLSVMALQTGQRVHANVISRTSVVSTLSVVTEASNL
jgi:hypothetical protein